MQGGNVGGTLLVAPDNARQGGYRNGLKRLGIGKAFLNEFGYFFVKMLLVPLADVLGDLFNGIVAALPVGIVVAIALVDERFQMIQ